MIFPRCDFIRNLQTLGFSLNEIREFLTLRIIDLRACSAVRKMLDHKLKDIHAKRVALVKLEDELRAALKKCKIQLKHPVAHTQADSNGLGWARDMRYRVVAAEERCTTRARNSGLSAPRFRLGRRGLVVIDTPSLKGDDSERRLRMDEVLQSRCARNAFRSLA
jgi:DNA-binding transcriptional MerR regulator